MTKLLISLVAILAAACSHATPPPPATPHAAATSASAAPAPAAAPRFDDLVRQDFFDGMRGDAAAFARAMKLCEDTLAAHPQHAEAMVWHGAGQVFRAGQAFRAGDQAAGLKLYQQGLAEMDHAVALAPNRPGVRIPRGAVLLAMAPHVPEPERTRLVRNGVADYEATLAAQRAYFAKLPLHAREQLLYGLTDGYAMLGERDKARAFYQRMQQDAAGSELLARAKLRADGQPVTGPTPCEQCHAR